jgi:hypothetical protein
MRSDPRLARRYQRLPEGFSERTRQIRQLVVDYGSHDLHVERILADVAAANRFPPFLNNFNPAAWSCDGAASFKQEKQE